MLCRDEPNLPFSEIRNISRGGSPSPDEFCELRDEWPIQV